MNVRFRSGLSLLLMFLCGCQMIDRDSSNEDDEKLLDSGGQLDSAQADFDVLEYNIDISVHPRRRSIDGKVILSARATAELGRLMLNLDNRLRVSEVLAGEAGNSIAFQHSNHQLWIDFPEAIKSGALFDLTIVYRGRPRVAERAPWDGGFTWSETESGAPWIATTVQGEGADLWWPCKDHPSDKADAVTIAVTVPKPLVAVSNGVLKEVRDVGKWNQTFVWRTEYPVSNYNVAINIGPYHQIDDTYESISGVLVPAIFWVLPESREKGEAFMGEIKEHLNFYERYLGPYPFREEKYGVVQTPHLGMEHQTVIAYGNNFEGGPHGYDWLHHHELGHEWWGNLVTAEDWRDFWIHEGFCTYMQALYAEEREGMMAYHHAMYTNRGRVDSEYPLVPDEPTGTSAIFEHNGSDVYFKGTWVLHSLRYLIGKDRLLQSLRRMTYPTVELEESVERAEPRFANSKDFIDIVESVAGNRFDWFFDAYLKQAALPALLVSVEGDELWLRWKMEDGFDFPMPIEIEIGGINERHAMPNGELRLDAEKYAGARFDPNSWILKEERLLAELVEDTGL